MNGNLEICFGNGNKIKTIPVPESGDAIYKQVIKAADYPDDNKVLIPLSSGDTIVIHDTKPVKIGDKYKKYPAKIHHIFYEPKKWWQFWKKKKQLGYIVKWE